jgi:hypothetical protein
MCAALNADDVTLNDGSDMDAAVQRLSEQIDIQSRAHLNRVSEEVFLSHAGQPVEDVLALLMQKAETSTYLPQVATLQRAARAISVGRRFAFV